MSDQTSRYNVALAFALGAGILAGPLSAQANPTVRSWTIPVVDSDPVPTPLPIMFRSAHSSSLLAATSSVPAEQDPQIGRQYTASLHLEKAIVGRPAGALHTVLTVKNTSPSVLNYTRGGLGCVWQILDKSGTVLYDSSKGKLIPHFMMLRHLEPGQTDTYTGVIPLKDNDGRALASGQYTLRAKPWTSLSITADMPFAIAKTNEQEKHEKIFSKSHSGTFALRAH
jgi:hypothetical protein